MKKNIKRALATAVSSTVVLASAFSVYAGAPAEVKKESIADMKVSEFGTNNTDTTRAAKDSGHLYIGAAITDGAVDEANSNWADQVTANEDGSFNLELNNEVEGVGFTAARLFNSKANITGNLTVYDDGDASVGGADFTGAGAAVSLAENAEAYVKDVTFNSDGFVRGFAVLQGGKLVIEDSSLTGLGANPLTEVYDGYQNTSDTSVMISPPWILGLSGSCRVITVIGSYPNLVVADSDIATGGWAAISTDMGTSPELDIFNSNLKILSEAEGGLDSGWKILGYDENAYGSGYGSFYIGGAQTNFYGSTIDGATTMAVFMGGDGTYQGMKAGETYVSPDAATGEDFYTYTAEEDVPMVANTVFGIIAQAAGSLEFGEGAVINTENALALYRSADVDWIFSGAEISSKDGVIIQMIDNDNETVSTNGQYFDKYLIEEAGFKTEACVPEYSYNFTEDTDVDPDKTYYHQSADGYEVVENPTQQGLVEYFERSTGGNCGTAVFSNGAYEGNIYNGTGYYNQAGDGLKVTIEADASLNGDIALTSHVHGFLLGDRNVDDVIAAIDEVNADRINAVGFYADTDPIEYVFINSDAQITDNKEEAVAIQFTKFSTLEYYLIGHVINMVNYNGEASIDVTVEGTWTPVDVSLVTYLNVLPGAHVYGELIENEDGSLTIIPSDSEIAAGEYGKALNYVATDSSGDSASGESASESAEAADDAESADSEGAAADSEGAAADSEGAAADSEGAAADSEGAESADGESPDETAN